MLFCLFHLLKWEWPEHAQSVNVIFLLHPFYPASYCQFLYIHITCKTESKHFNAQRHDYKLVWTCVGGARHALISWYGFHFWIYNLWWHTTPFSVPLWERLWALCFGACMRAITVLYFTTHPACPKSKHYKIYNTIQRDEKTGFLPQDIYHRPECLRKALGKKACHLSCISQHHFQLRPQSQSASGKPLDCTDKSFE